MKIDDYTREEKDQALDEAWEIMNPKTETDEERWDLEKIKSYDDSWWLRYLEAYSVFDTEGIKAQKDWLIERVQELEDEVALVNDLMNDVRRSGYRAVEKNERLKEALKFYANQKNYTQGFLKQAVLLDGGRAASKALEVSK